MTSNIGSSYLLEGITPEGEISAECESAVLEELRRHFRPEFLNRLDETILFKPLTSENIGDILDLMVKELNERLSDREISVELTTTAKEFIIKNAYDPIYGARPLRRYLQKNVETLSARLILADKVGSMDTIVIDVKNNALTAYVRVRAEEI